MNIQDISNFIAVIDLKSFGIGGVVGALIGALLNHWLSKSRGKHERFISASKVFRNAFSEELSKLMNSDEDPVTILQPAYLRHTAAVSEFSIYLDSGNKRKFTEAWNVYAFHPQNIEVPFLEQYSKYLGDVHAAKQNRQLAVNRLDNLIAYAKHT